jgi:hypothetical protein
MRTLAFVAILALTSSAVFAADTKSGQLSVDQKRSCRDSTTIVDMLATERDRGMTLQQARNQRIGLAEVQKLLNPSGQQLSEAVAGEASAMAGEISESLIDVVFITLASTPRRQLVAEFFETCIKEFSKPSK